MSAEALVELNPIVRVVVSGFEPSYRESLRKRLSQEESFATFFLPGSWDQVLSDCQRMFPCVWIVSEYMVGQVDRAEFGQRVSYGRLVQVLVVGDTVDAESQRTMLRVGCSGFLPTDASAETICKAVKAVSQGELWVNRKLACQVLQESLQQSSQPSLTPRENQILRMIMEGETNRSIGDTLHITRDTVRWHIRSLYNKIGVKDRLSAVYFARDFFGPDASSGGAGLKGKRPLHSVDLGESQSRPEQWGPSR